MTDSEHNFEELSQKVDYLVEIVRQLERRLVVVEKLLRQESNSINLDAVTVTGAMETSSIVKLDLSELELLEIYNNDYQKLAHEAIKVSVTANSLLQQSNNAINAIFLEKSRKGNYWIIATEDDNYWLLPKAKLRIDIYKYETVKSLFQCNGYEANADSEFTLIKLAKVSLMPKGQQWALEEPGVLNFGKTSLDESEDTHPEVLNDVIESCLNDVFENSEDVPNQDIVSDRKEEQSASTNEDSEVEALLLVAYNEKQDSLLIHTTEVLETEESINRRHFGTSRSVVFEKVILGIYWIVTVEHLNYLVPKWDIKIGLDDLETVRDLFECQGYQPEHSHEFKLIKPARVSPLTQGENWVLVTQGDKWVLLERGILQFASTLDKEPSSTAASSEDTPVPKQNIQLLKTLSEHTNTVRSIAINPQGNILASGSFDNTIKIWDLHQGEILHTITGLARVNYVAFNPDGHTLASVSSSNNINIWNVASGTSHRIMTGHSRSILTLAISPDGQMLASGGIDQTIKIWNQQTGDLLHTLVGHGGTVVSLAFSPDGCTVASSSSDTTIKLWNTDTGDLLHTIFGHPDLFWSIAFSRDGRTLVSGSHNCSIKLWNLDTGKLQHTLIGHLGPVWSIAMSSNGQILVSGSGDKTIKVWEFSTGALLSTLVGHSNEVYAVAISKDGRTLASSSNDKTIKIWQLSV